MKFWEKKRHAPLTVVVLGEYNVISRFYLDLFVEHTSLNVYVFKWECMHREAEWWTYPQFVDFVRDAVGKLPVDWSRTILIGHGLGGTIANFFAQEFQPLGLGVVSPIFYLNFINPFASRIPSYKPNLHSVYLTMRKMYLHPEDFYGSISDWPMVRYYDFYLKNMMFFETIRAQVSHYETLVQFRKREVHNYKKNFMVYGSADGITDPKMTIKLLKKRHHFQNEWDAYKFDESAHCALFEQPGAFFKIFWKKVAEWSKDDFIPHPGIPRP